MGLGEYFRPNRLGTTWALITLDGLAVAPSLKLSEKIPCGASPTVDRERLWTECTRTRHVKCKIDLPITENGYKITMPVSCVASGIFQNMEDDLPMNRHRQGRAVATHTCCRNLGVALYNPAAAKTRTLDEH